MPPPKLLLSLIRRVGSVSRIIIRSTLYTLTAVIALVFVVASYSPLMPPVRMVTPAFLGLAFPITMIAMGLTTLYWLVRRRWRVIIVLIGVWLLCWSSVRAYTPLNRSEMPQELVAGQHLKVLTYNVAAFGFVPHSPSAPNPILQYIRSSNADLVCLQEAMLSDNSWGTISAQQIRRYLRDIYPHIKVLQPRPRGTTLILLSKYSIRSAEKLSLDSRLNGATLYHLDVDGRDLRLINVHLESFHLQRQDGEQYVDLAKSGNAVGLREALSAKLGPAFRRRNIQTNHLANLIDSLGRDHLLICGDFNDTPVSYTHRKLSEGMQDAFVATGSGFGFTYSSGVYQVRIDHVLVGSALKPLETHVDYSITTSDHYPVVATLEWQNARPEPQ